PRRRRGCLGAADGPRRPQPGRLLPLTPDSGRSYPPGAPGTTTRATRTAWGSVPLLIVQEKAIASGEIPSWTLAFSAAQPAIGWAGRQAQVLEREAQEMSRDFPTWVVAAGQRLPVEESSVDSGELTLCPSCSDLCPFFDPSFALLGA